MTTPTRTQLVPLLLTLALFARAAIAQPQGVIKPVNPRCEYLTNPLAVDVDKPRLSWELEPNDPKARGFRQTAFEVSVFPDERPANPEHSSIKPIWESGKINSSQTSLEYSGEKLKPGTAVVWTVRVWDQDGHDSRWIGGNWRTGLNPVRAGGAFAGWGAARWIGDATPAPKEGFDPLPAPMLRKQFSCDKKKGGLEVRATLYATSLGLYNVTINGTPAERDLFGKPNPRELAPEWTDYTKRVQYQAYDVSSLVKQGDNCIGVTLGDGWYAGKVGLAHINPKGPPRAIYGRTPALLLRLDIELADGSKQTVVSDGSWRSTLAGPIRSDDLLDGETYDARAEVPGWDKPGFDDSKWTPVAAFDKPNLAFVAQTNEPMRVNRELKAAAISEPKPGVFVFDMAQNMVGHCRFKLRGHAGQTVTIRHAEVLNADGTIYTTNLRGAAQTDRYTFKSDAEETWEPRFTYHGFRYVELAGLPTENKPSLDAVTGCVMNSAATETSTFECSDPMVNRLWQNILWTQRGNLVGVPTDCPQRDERCGWMGDILAFAPTACFNMDMAAFFTKWLQDTRDAQARDGRFADFSPQPYDPNVRFSGVPAWGDAGVFVPWAAYQFYGDTRILADQYDACVRWIEFIHAKNPDLLWKNSRGNDYGDWLNADTLKLQGWPAKGAEVPKEVFATIFFYRSTQIVSEMAGVLGRKDDQAKYAALADGIRAAFVRAYISDGSMRREPEDDAQAPLLKGGTQAGYALALHFGLIPDHLQAAATQYMVDRFKPYNGQISTGFHSTLPLMTELSLRGHNDDAYRLLLNRNMPSWGYEIDHGATTIWERWDGYVEGRGFQDPGMNSFAHYAIGAVGEWMFGTMLGIEPETPGFASVIIHPNPGPGITWAKGTYHSIRGRIASSWEQRQDGLHVSVTIPPNVSAKVILPAGHVLLDGRPAAESHDVTMEKGEGTICRVGSGSYEFLVRLQP